MSFDKPSFLTRLPLVEGTCPTHGQFSSPQRADNRVLCPHCVLQAAAASLTNAQTSRKLTSFWIGGEKTHTPPSRFASASFSSFICQTPQQERILDLCSRYATNFSREASPALLTGGIGTGKTHLAIALVNAIASREHRAAYITMPELFRLMQDRRTADRSIASELNSYDFLAIDEIGVIPDINWQKEFARQALFQIIDTRYAKKLPVALISNLTTSDLCSEIGERTFDRLRGAIVMPFQWESRRG